MNLGKGFSRIGWGCAAVAAVLISSRASANDVSVEQSPLQRVVMLSFSDEVEEEFAQAIRAGLSDMAVAFEIRRPVTDATVEIDRWASARSMVGGDFFLFAFWIELEPRPVIRFYIPKADGEVQQTRQLGANGIENASENAAILVRRWVLSLATTAVEPSPETVEPTEPDTSPADGKPVIAISVSKRGPLRQLPHRFVLDAAFRSIVQSSAHPALMGARFQLAAGLTRGLMPFVAYTIQAATVDQAAGVHLTVNRHPVEAGVRAVFLRPRGRVRAALFGAVCFDVVSPTTAITSNEYVAASDGNQLEVSAVAGVSAMIQIAGPAYFTLSIGAKIPIIEARFQLQNETDSRVLHDSWPVQPDLMSGLLFQFW